jgi:hypothetical protein
MECEITPDQHWDLSQSKPSSTDDLFPLLRFQATANGVGGVDIPSHGGRYEAYFVHPKNEDLRIQIEACRKSANFHMDQYLRYLKALRGSGMDPKELQNGIGNVFLDPSIKAPITMNF